MTTLSIIVPSYNEELRLGATLVEIGEFVSDRPDICEVIVVDDGSIDATAEVAQASTCPGLRVVRHAENLGKGAAVRRGMNEAVGDLRLFVDADGSTPMTEFAKLEKALDEIGGSGIAFASIGIPGAEVTQAQAGIRPLAGRIGNWLIRLLAVRGVRDSQRGFKLFSADAARAIFPRAVVDRWAFDVETLVLARRLGFPIVEVPVTWAHKDDSRVTPLSYLSTLADVLRVRWRIARNAYSGLDG